MKPKNTLLLFAVFLALLAAVLLFDSKEKKGEAASEKLVALKADSLEKIELKTQDKPIVFNREKDGTWMMTAPFNANTDTYEVDRLAEGFSDLKFTRIVETEPQDLKKYGIPDKEVTLHFKSKQAPVRILIGMENPLDKTYFAKRQDETRVVLLPNTINSLLEKSVFDFRKKDIFHFDTGDVKELEIKNKMRSWAVQKEKDDWWLESPVKALANKSKINTLLSSLSDLKAKSFTSENKTKAELKKHHLDSPDYQAFLTFPKNDRKIIFYLHKTDDTTFTSTSLSSKIISVENSILDDMDKKIEELRDKKIAHFFSWEADKIEVRSGGKKIGAAKDAEGNWILGTKNKAKGDKNKIEDLLRKVESLGAESFIDSPLDLKAYGLDSPETEIAVWSKESGSNSKKITILVGKKDENTKTVVVKNPHFNYLFKVKSAFLDTLPKTENDWVIKPPEKK